MLRTFTFLNSNQQMAVGTYERKNSVKLALTGHAGGERETQKHKLKKR
jgi:hypothetical protein